MAVPPFSLSQITTRGWPFERDVDAFAAAGVSAIGVSIEKLEQYGVARAAARLRDAGLAVSCLTSSGGFPLGDRVRGQEVVERTRRHIDAAGELEADCLLVLPGKDPVLSWEEAADRARPLLEALLPHAERACVRLALEPTSQLRMDLAFVHSFGEALDLVGEFASPWLGVVLELNNAWIERGLYDNIRQRTGRIALVQVSDFKVGTVASSQRLVPGDGDIPIARILGTVLDAGYRGVFDLELIGDAINAEGYDAAVPRAVGALGTILDELGA